MKKLYLIIFISLIFVYACKNETNLKMSKIKSPKANKIPKNLEKHGDIRVDNYYWLNERDNPEVIDYLERENDYNDKMTAHTKEFQKNLFEEMKARIKEDDESVPYKYNGYWYVTRFEEGKQYPIYTRKKETLDAPEEIMFDCNKMAEGHEYFSLGGIKISPDNKLAAFGVDTVSRRIYTIQVKNLETGEILPDKIENTTGGSTWANDNKTLFYTNKDPQTLRSNKIFKHTLGNNQKDDKLVYHEEDETFYTFVYKTKSRDYIVIGSTSTLTSEYQLLKADDPNGTFSVFQPRKRGLEYSIYNYQNEFYVLTNADGATNFKLMKTTIDKTTMEHWIDVIPHRENVLLENISIFKDYLVLEERENGLNNIRVKRWDGSADYQLPFDEETYSVGVYGNPEFDTDIIRYGYNSFTTPSSVIDFNMSDQSKEVKKEQEVLGGEFDKNNYTSERLWIDARDGKKVAVSIVRRKDTEFNKDTPLLLYAYGSYGHTISDGFSTTRLSLLDRGFVYALAHIRGSEYLGREWYEDGKLFNKMNTFTDFIDAGKGLIQKGCTSAHHLYAMGGSAGGLLMGVVVNMNPEIFNGVIAAVPFVDVMTTMLDETIPLTTGEYDEWGNPNEKDYYDYMLSYSPYDQVSPQKYPNILVTTGLHDSQVQYYEPAKWVAKLRDYKTDNNVLLMHTNMEAGHGGASGRFNALKETARDYAFFLDLEGIKK